MLTSYPDEEAVIAAIVAGASGYLLKQVRARDLVAALEAVGRGESLLDPAVTGKVLERMRRIANSDQPDELSALTQQERKILALVAEGKTNKEIAAEVFLSGQDREELRELDPREAQPRAAGPGRGVRREAQEPHGD
jgi:DNA-binding NarL/FixJ family response regulator